MSLINFVPSRQRPTWDQVKEIQDHIDANSRKREENEVFVDARDGKQLHRQHEAAKTSIRMMKQDLITIRDQIGQTEKEIKGLEKIEANYQKMLAKKAPKPAANPNVIRGTMTADRRDVRTPQQRELDRAKERLSALQKKLQHTEAMLSQGEAGLKVFLAAKPRPHLQSNAEMIADYVFAEKMEQEFRNAMRQPPTAL